MNLTPLLNQIRVYSQALVEDLPEATPARLEPRDYLDRPVTTNSEPGRSTDVDAAEADAPERCGTELTVFDLCHASENETTRTPKRSTMVAGAVAAAIVLVLGVVVLGDGDGDNVVTDAASSPSATETVPLPGVADSVPSDESPQPLETRPVSSRRIAVYRFVEIRGSLA